MKIRIVAVGKMKERYLQQAIEEYLKRISAFFKIELIELKNKDSIMRYKGQNAVLLDEKGKEFSSVAFAGFIKRYDDLTFIIGDYDGWDEKIKKEFNKISLSQMTFTHELARLFLIEQIYRAAMINSNRPYHK